MKNYNKNIIVFVICSLFVCAGMFSSEMYKEMGQAFNNFINGKASKFTRIAKLENKIDGISTEKLLYHDQMMDVNSVLENIKGTRVVPKKDVIVAKSNNGSLLNSEEKIADEDINTIVAQIKRVKDISEEYGAKFLYCSAPRKEIYESAPENVDNYLFDNYSYFLRKMKSEDIPYIDFLPKMDTLSQSCDVFFKTDHHWTPRAGFFAYKAICEDLNMRYDFVYDNKLTDLHNYSITLYDNWFLGSRGKKTGKYFTWSGPDDFELITPKFKTNLAEIQPIKNETRYGEFNDTVLYMENMEKNYYNINTYATYSGGDFRLQIMKNRQKKQGCRVLLIRDSFACVVAPFLSLQTSELHVCDMRDFEEFVGDKINVAEYINEIRPDYVLVLYSGVKSLDNSNGKYDFF